MDPWMLLRNLLHLHHPRSALSSDTLVGNAFFGHKFPQDQVRDFAQWMSQCESMGWPVGMMNRFTNVSNILQNIQGLGSSAARIMVMAGTEDKLMGVKLMQDMAGEYRDGIRQLSDQKKIEPTVETGNSISKNVKQETENGVSMVIVEGAGHHIQNDVQADEAAEALKMFVEQL
jgi:pimeloyl-ACP methyl ester carboxylesterase